MKKDTIQENQETGNITATDTLTLFVSTYIDLSTCTNCKQFDLFFPLNK